jgi:hypothetical protein
MTYRTYFTVTQRPRDQVHVVVFPPLVCCLTFVPHTDHILHVGLHTEGNRELRNAKWGTQEKAGTLTSESPKQVLYLTLLSVARFLQFLPRA